MPLDMKGPPLAFHDAVARVKSGANVNKVTEDFVAQLTDDEKLWMLDGDVSFWQGLGALYAGEYFRKPYSFGAIPELKFPGARYVDGPRGINIFQATAFPVSMARGATWDPELEERIGRAIGLEARAMGANLVGSVCINLPRHPAWGRIQETYSEDPVLLGEFGVAHVRGLQSNVMACVKHYALNSMEYARFRVNVVVDDDVLHEVYLPHFLRCVEAGAASFMTSYNAINDSWGGESKELITTVLYDTWKYQGFTISDWVFGLRDGIKSIQAGLTLEAPFQNCRARTVKAGLASGAITWSQIESIDQRLVRTLLQHYASRKEAEPPREVVLSHEHRALAREAATRSIVLLKNEPVGDTPLLPLSLSIESCAVIGRLANSEGTGDSSSSMVNCPSIVTPFQGIRASLGPDRVLLSNSDSVDSAVNAAKRADVAVLIIGYDDKDEGEFLTPSRSKDPEAFAAFPPYDNSPYAQKLQQATSGQAPVVPKLAEKATQFGDFSSRPKVGDRLSVRLRKADVRLIEAVTKVNPRTVVTIVTAGAVITEEWRHMVSTLLVSWYNGCEGGNGLADILFGKSSPSGRLPWSMPKDEAHLPTFEPFAHRVVYDKWFGQRKLDEMGIEAAYPLGYGIGFTRFLIKQATLAEYSGGDGKDDSIIARVNVANVGTRVGRCVVQVYGSPRRLDKTVPFPSRVLLGFRSIEIEAQQTKTTIVTVSLRPLQRWNNGRFMMSSAQADLHIGQYCGDPDSVSCLYQQFNSKA